MPETTTSTTASTVTPNGELAIRVLAMPADTNPAGDIFGGWLMARMDQAGATVAVLRAGGRVVTVAVEAMSFLKPVYVGDIVSCYGAVVAVGRTSLKVEIETWARRGRNGVEEKVTAALFTYVAVDADRKPRLVPTVIG